MSVEGSRFTPANRLSKAEYRRSRSARRIWSHPKVRKRKSHENCSISVKLWGSVALELPLVAGLAATVALPQRRNDAQPGR